MREGLGERDIDFEIQRETNRQTDRQKERFTFAITTGMVVTSTGTFTVELANHRENAAYGPQHRKNAITRRRHI